MNVYDFDNTLYDGESSFDFFLYCLRRRPVLLRHLPKVLRFLARYKRAKVTHEMLLAEMDAYAEEVYAILPDVQALTLSFWKTHEKKLRKAFYQEHRRPDDVVVSASFDFFLKPACDMLGVKTVLGSSFDFESGKVVRLCFADEKPRVFGQAFPEAVIDAFYTDSLVDTPLSAKAKKAYLVKKDGRVVPFPEK